MGLKQFTLTVKAEEVIAKLPSRGKSKFVCDAIIEYSKKKDIMDYYCSQEEDSKKSKNKNSGAKPIENPSSEDNVVDNEVNTSW
jgi:hypothetical protein